MYGLITGAAYILSGASDLALIIGGDCNSRILNPDDIKTYPLFGDGAGAVVVLDAMTSAANPPVAMTVTSSSFSAARSRRTMPGSK